jgi:hypothetical protein
VNHKVIIVLSVLSFSILSDARECNLPEQWKNLCSILEERIQQSSLKMKLKEDDVSSLEQFLSNKTFNFHHLKVLEKVLPKTTVELLIALQSRGVSFEEVEAIAQYLGKLVASFGFENVRAFDSNTSHIIGREWHEIDYSGEGMSWEKQRKKYAPHGIKNFKTVDILRKFFLVESKLPYFKKIYKPTFCEELAEKSIKAEVQ